MFMHKWCAATAVAALLALPLFGQQKDDSANQPTTGTTASADTPAPAPETAVHATRGVFALPGAPKATPFPGPQAAAKTDKKDDAPGRLVRRYELAGGYSYINLNPGDPFNNFGNQGATGGFTYNANRYLGLTGELGGYSFDRNVNGNQITGGVLNTFLFGPRLNMRKFDHFVPFGEFLIGGAHGGSEITGGPDQSAFALAAGGRPGLVFSKKNPLALPPHAYLTAQFHRPHPCRRRH